MKLTLGTVQFGMKYGISNSTGEVSDKQFNSIITSFRSAGYNTFDTAHAYGNSERRLSRVLQPSDCVTTKIPPNISMRNHEAWFEKSISCSLNNLSLPAVETLIFHRSIDLLATPKSFLDHKIKVLKDTGVINKFGVSVYQKEELDKVMDHVSIDFVQFPLNLFDRSFLTGNYLIDLKDKGLTLEARSVFLQGLLLMEQRLIPHYFSPWLEKFEKFDMWLSRFDNITRLDACISFVNSIPEIDRMVIGVQNVTELNEIIESLNILPFTSYPDIASSEQALINPSFWHFKS